VIENLLAIGLRSVPTTDYVPVTSTPTGGALFAEVLLVSCCYHSFRLRVSLA
jgi:hypothetical protein